MDRVLAIIDRLISRKLWVAVAAEVFLLFPDMDDELRGIIMGGVGMVYILAQALIDAIEGTKPVSNADREDKLRFQEPRRPLPTFVKRTK